MRVRNGDFAAIMGGGCSPLAGLRQPDPLVEAVRHVLRYGKLGKQSRRRLESALAEATGA